MVGSVFLGFVNSFGVLFLEAFGRNPIRERVHLVGFFLVDLAFLRSRIQEPTVSRIGSGRNSAELLQSFV